MLERFRSSETTTFFRVLYRASPGLATLWWALLLLRGTMPALLAVSTGVLVGAVRDGADLAAPLTFVSVVFVLVQVLAPVHQAVSAVLGAAAAEWLQRPADGRRPSRRRAWGTWRATSWPRTCRWPATSTSG